MKCVSNIVVKVAVFFCAFSVCRGYNILCLFPYPGKSHHVVFDPLVEELTHRGHNVTVVSFFPSSNPPKNRRDVSLVGLAPLNIEVVNLTEIEYSVFGLEKYFEHVPLIVNLARFNLALCERILDSEVFKEFLSGKGDYDVILVEHFNSDCMLGVIHNYGMPSIGVISSTLLPWTLGRAGAPDNPAFTPNMLLQLTDEMTFAERLENTFYHYFYNIWFRVAIRTEEHKLLESRLRRQLPTPEEIAKNTSLVLVNTHYTLNGVKALPPGIVEIGGVHLNNRTPKSLPHDIEHWVSEAQDGFIVFSFGSLIRGSSLSSVRVKILLKSFKKLKQRVIWKWEGENLKDLPANVLTRKWIPQYDLLNHPNCVAFITHGGLLSVTEAVDAGVPMLVIPILGDQFGNAAHTVRAGVAVSLRIQQLTEDLLDSSLQNILSSKMRDKAKVFRQEWRDRPVSPMETAVYWVERVARGLIVPLGSPSRHLPYHIIYQFDIIATFSILLIVIVFLLYKLLIVFKTQIVPKQKQL